MTRTSHVTEAARFHRGQRCSWSSTLQREESWRCGEVLELHCSQGYASIYSYLHPFIIWLTDFACCDWSIPGP